MVESKRSSTEVPLRPGIQPANKVSSLSGWISTQQQSVGWKSGIAVWTAVVTIVLLFNTIISIVVGARYGYESGLGILHEGDCNTVGSYDTGAHILINLLSTLLLSGGNYCMQCLTAPSRREIDKAHKFDIPLEIGVASLSNLRHIDRWKLSTWIILAISSLPLHLLYNSVVFSSLCANSYMVLNVNDAFVTSRNFNASAAIESVGLGDWGPQNDLVATQMQFNASQDNLERLENQDCIAAYGQTYLSSHRNLLLVSTSQESNEDAKVYQVEQIDPSRLDAQEECAPDPVSWMCFDIQCNNPCINRLQDITNDPTAWSPFGIKVEYCLSQVVDQRCQLNFSLPLAITVIIFNLVKAVVMLFIIFNITENRIHTIGDAIRSYLVHRDEQTSNCCLLNAEDFRSHGFIQSTKPWKNERRKFSHNASLARWTLSLLFYSMAIGVSIFLLAYGILHTPGHPNASNLLKLPFGSISAETIIHWELPSSDTSGFAANVLIANFPQLILSAAYLNYNGLFTSMLAAYEWSQMAWHQKGLRVSHNPQGAQRSTYFLQLPYRYAIPLLIGSGAMHWLVSQSLFLVTVLRYDILGQPLGDDLEFQLELGSSSQIAETTHYSCGWSPIAVLCVIIGGLVMICTALFVGRRFHLQPGMPLGGTCSAVIAAACFVDDTEIEDGDPLETRALKWGVIRAGAAEGIDQIDPEQGDEQEQTIDIRPVSAVKPSSFAPFSASRSSIFSNSTAYNPVSSSTDIELLLLSDPNQSEHRFGHCAFSSRDPEFPQEGVLYR